MMDDLFISGFFDYPEDWHQVLQLHASPKVPPPDREDNLLFDRDNQDVLERSANSGRGRYPMNWRHPGYSAPSGVCRNGTR